MAIAVVATCAAWVRYHQRELRRERRAQIGPAHDHALETLARDDGFETPTLGFNFGELWHPGYSMARLTAILPSPS